MSVSTVEKDPERLVGHALDLGAMQRNKASTDGGSASRPSLERYALRILLIPAHVRTLCGDHNVAETPSGATEA